MTMEIKTREAIVVDCCDDAGDLLGSCLLTRFDERSYFLSRLLVNPIHRRRGVASAIVAKAQGIAQADGRPLVLKAKPFSSSPVSAELLRAWYLSIGFAAVPSSEHGELMVFGSFGESSDG